jgi:hypothetical protein
MAQRRWWRATILKADHGFVTLQLCNERGGNSKEGDKEDGVGRDESDGTKSRGAGGVTVLERVPQAFVRVLSVANEAVYADAQARPDQNKAQPTTPFHNILAVSSTNISNGNDSGRDTRGIVGSDGGDVNRSDFSSGSSSKVDEGGGGFVNHGNMTNLVLGFEHNSENVMVWAPQQYMQVSVHCFKDHATFTHWQAMCSKAGVSICVCERGREIV